MFQNWYDQKHNLFDAENPVKYVATASCLNYDLCADQIYTKLVKIGYLVEEGDTVMLQLPETGCLKALEKGLQKWKQTMLGKLGDLTVRNYEYFAKELIEVNAEIQGLTSHEMGRYCEVEFAKQYPMFKMTIVDNMIGNLSVEDMDVTEEGDTERKLDAAQAEEMECAEELPTKIAPMFPLNLQPEVAHALVILGKTNQKSLSVQEAVSLIQSVCKIKYVVSPKYILSSIANKDKISKFKEDFTVTLHLGGTVSKKASEVSEITKLALILSFPGKGHVFKKHSRQLERMQKYAELYPERKQNPLQIPMRDIHDILRSFQNTIYTQSQEKARRERATVILNDAVVESQCQQKLYTWLDSVNDDPNSRLTEEEFSKKLIELSFEKKFWPSDDIIQKLCKLGYLNMQGDRVCYNPNYRARGVRDDEAEIQRFLQRWHTDLKPRDTSKPSAAELPIDSCHSRKRTCSDLNSSGVKKAKVLNL